MPPRAKPLLYSLTAFVSAFLLFSAQPMVARMALPRLGGSPAVWLSCQLFFQAALLAGYWYAHQISTRLTPGLHLRLHLALLGGAALLLPLGLPADWTAPARGLPVLHLLGTLALHGGLPLLAVCSTAPLLQRWLSWSERDPYWLYAASNAGSFAALALYPLLVEPSLRLSVQSRLWSAGYVVFAVLTAICLFAAAPPPAERRAKPAPPVPWGRKLRWLALAFAPASVSLGTTSYVTANIAPIPLFWVLPLGVYLASFIFAFSRRPKAILGVVSWLLPLLLALVLRTFALSDGASLAPAFFLHMLVLAALATALHCRLADDRPGESGLTEYYLWLSVGGVLAGLFNAVLVPLIMKWPVEYPVSLCLAALLLPSAAEKDWDWRSWTAAAAAAALVKFSVADRLGFEALDVAVLAFVYACATLRLDLRPGLAVLCLCAAWSANSSEEIFMRDRSFFGAVHAADYRSDDGERLRRLQHGNTTHGVQSWNRPDEPLSYYGQSSGAGRLIRGACGKDGCPRTAVIGLGAGTLAAYAGHDYRMDFYEIDPMIVRLAEDPKLFTYLSNARKRGARIGVTVGDGRLRLAEAPDAHYGLIVVDAFGSDAIPTHLLTREAFALYLRKLNDGGVVAVHVSNRHLRLPPVLGDVARELGLAGRVHRSVGVDAATFESVWVVIGRAPRAVSALSPKDGWEPLEGVPGRAAWEDERLDLLSAVAW